MNRILIVDDSRFMRSIIVSTLKAKGMTNFDEASNGLEAVEKCQKTHYDLITMDITMDKMDGITALKKIKNIDDKAKIIVVSAMGQKVFITEAIKHGAIDFVIKPFDRTAVDKAVEKYINI